MNFSIALVQFDPTRKNVEKNIHQVSRLIKNLKADLIVLPELANSGYLYETPGALEPFSEPQDGSGPFLQAMRDLVAQTDSMLITGYAERAGDKLFNSATAITAEGVRLNYRKAHLFDQEKALFTPGDTGFQVVNWRSVRIGVMICFDWIFPEAARALALKGAQIIAHPANLVLPYCQSAMVTRSIENQVFTVTANRTGSEKLGNESLSFTGQSQITAPNGKVLFRGPSNKTTVHLIVVDPDLALDKQINPNNDLFSDRRPDQYDNR